MKTFFLRFFTWWNGVRLGTLLWTSLRGEFVGEDEFGNRYYRTRGGAIDPALGFERRWVIYNGTAEASAVPSSWHGWLHHTVDVPPTEDKVAPRPWWKPHRPNLTGTPAAPLPPAPRPPPARPVRRSPRAAGRRRPATTRPGRRAADGAWLCAGPFAENRYPLFRDMCPPAKLQQRAASRWNFGGFR